MGRHAVLVLFLGATLLAGCGPGGPAKGGAMEGQRLPDAEFTTLSGEKLRVSDFAGRPVVLNFWATWCGPCKEEIPELQAAYDQYSASNGLQIIGITSELPADVEPFVAANGMTFPIAYDSSGQTGDRFRVQGIPTTLFIDAQGIVATRHTGALGQGRLRLYIERLLSGGGGEPAAPPAAPTAAPPAPTVAPPPSTGGDSVGWARRRD